MTFRDELAERYPNTVAAAARGNRPACIKLQCLECVGGRRDDVRDCTDRGCQLYPVRPYKTDAELAALAQAKTPEQLERARKSGERLAELSRLRKTPNETLEMTQRDCVEGAPVARGKGRSK